MGDAAEEVEGADLDAERGGEALPGPGGEGAPARDEGHGEGDAGRGVGEGAAHLAGDAADEARAPVLGDGERRGARVGGEGFGPGGGGVLQGGRGRGVGRRGAGVGPAPEGAARADPALDHEDDPGGPGPHVHEDAGRRFVEHARRRGRGGQRRDVHVHRHGVDLDLREGLHAGPQRGLRRGHAEQPRPLLRLARGHEVEHHLVDGLGVEVGLELVLDDLADLVGVAEGDADLADGAVLGGPGEDDLVPAGARVPEEGVHGLAHGLLAVGPLGDDEVPLAEAHHAQAPAAPVRLDEADVAGTDVQADGSSQGASSVGKARPLDPRRLPGRSGTW